MEIILSTGPHHRHMPSAPVWNGWSCRAVPR